MAALRYCPAGHELAVGAARQAVCPRCRKDMIVAVVAVACPELPADEIAAAVDATITSAAAARDLAAAVSEGPEVLAGGAPPVVARLVGELRARGSALPEPACSHCGRVGLELIRVATIGLCGRCRSRQLAEACSACGQVRVVYGRDNAGGALCPACAPRPARRCGRCGRTAPIARRARDGQPDICDSCFRPPVATCHKCGRRKPCNFAGSDRPICLSCSSRRQLRCSHCGQLRPSQARWPEGPVCEPCYRSALKRRGTCAGCGQSRRLVDPPGPGAMCCADCAGKPSLGRTCTTCGIEDLTYADSRCARCVLAERARLLCSDQAGQLKPELAALCDAVAAHPQPYSALNWLQRSASAALLAQIAASEIPLSHEALDARPGAAAEFLRQALLTAGLLPARDEALVRLESWVAERIATISDPHRARLLRSYATWRLLRRARQRAARSERPRTATWHTKTRLLAAIAFCHWIDQNDLPLAETSQSDIDLWMQQGGPSACNVRDFLEWTAQRHLTRHLEVPTPRSRQGASLDDPTHWAIVKQLLHDDTIELTDRVAGCLVLLYGQQLSRITAIRSDQITSHHDVWLNLGSSKVIIPEPLGALLTQLAATGRRYTGVGSPSPSPWLFPGLHAGRPLNPSHLGQRLRRLGIPTMPARRSALTHLAAQLPAAVLAELLNLHPTTAVHWVTAAGGDWNTYAAQIARTR
jgi:hypothetical protein